MRTRLFLLLLAASLSLGNAALIHLPLPAVNTSSNVAPWWQSNPPPAWVAGWQCWQATETNMTSIEGFMGALPDAQTNSVLNSYRQLAFSTNTWTTPFGTTNWLPKIFTNFAGVDSTVLAGYAQMVFSFDYGAHWVAAYPTLVTNVPVMVGWIANAPPLSAPIDVVVGNISVWTLTRPDLFAKTNALYGGHLLVGAPTQPDEVVSASWVSSQIANAGWQNVGTDIQLQGHQWHMGATWDQVLDTSNTNLDVYEVRWLGQPMLSIVNPVSEFGTVTNLVPYAAAAPVLASTNYQVGRDVWPDKPSETNNCLSLLIDTNSLSGVPIAEYTHEISPANWVRLITLSSWPTNVTLTLTTTNWATNGIGGYYITGYYFQTNSGVMLSFAMPNLDHGFVRLSSANPTPAVASLTGMLGLPPRTITNSTDTTWNQGAGLVCVDSNYVYVSVGTNLWRRAALGW